MRTTVSLDDQLLAQARELSGIPQSSQLIKQALQALIERESARRLVLLGGTEPELRPIPRRRSSRP